MPEGMPEPRFSGMPAGKTMRKRASRKSSGIACRQVLAQRYAQVRERAGGTPGVSSFRPDLRQTTTIISDESSALKHLPSTSKLPPDPPARVAPHSLPLDANSSTDHGANPIPSIDLNKLPQKPEKFSGDRDTARAWLEDYEAAIRANRWSNQIAVYYFLTFLTKQARNWFLTMVQPSLTSTTMWQEVRQ